MSNSKSTNSSGGIGVAGLLGVVFVTLKLCGVIDWSWWAVTMPFWIGFALLLGIFLVLAVAAFVVSLYETVKREWASQRKGKQR